MQLMKVDEGGAADFAPAWPPRPARLRHAAMPKKKRQKSFDNSRGTYCVVNDSS